MHSPYAAFVNEDFQPDPADVVALFRMRPARGISWDEAMGRVASESSVGTWAELTETPDRIAHLAGRASTAGRGWMHVCYPRDLWEPGNVAQLLSGLAGNIFGMKAVESLRLEDLHLPQWWLRALPGPGVGIPGIRRMFDAPKRPIMATVPKPKLGFTAAEHTRVAKAAWLGGLDLVKDDENLTSQKFNRFEERVRRMAKARDAVELETGRHVSALLNVTAETDEAKRRLRILSEYGWDFAMIDVVVTGWSALQTLRRVAGEEGLAIHAHRAMHASFTRNPNHGISMPCLAKLLRATGVDSLHVGTVVGKLESPKAEVLASADNLRMRDSPGQHGCPAQQWAQTPATMPVASGGLHPGIVSSVLDVLGHECMVQAGGGIHGHPGGTRHGAEAFAAAVDAWSNGDPPPTGNAAYATALQQWSHTRPR